MDVLGSAGGMAAATILEVFSNRSDSMVLGGWTHLVQSRIGKEKQKQGKKKVQAERSSRSHQDLGRYTDHVCA